MRRVIVGVIMGGGVEGGGRVGWDRKKGCGWTAVESLIPNSSV